MQVPTKSKFKLSLSNTAMHQHSNRATKTNAIFSTISQNIDATYKTNLYKYTSILMIFQKVFGLSLFCQFHFLNPERTAADGTVQLGPFRYDNLLKSSSDFINSSKALFGQHRRIPPNSHEEIFQLSFNPFKKE